MDDRWDPHQFTPAGQSWDEVAVFDESEDGLVFDESEDDLVFDYEGLTNANEENTEVINDLDGEEYEECEVITSDNIWE
ncbi:4138_t:CDS:2 [Paraglomus brasilianum]|uniref:4138_t:CDS:1 n=1 Tax=Paraglomus brasilianum TaxID=144538 RepID=A0A9N9GDJ6_9GLOM|nr:4138_t:CDS:2 [Paraglomus brasilianum]